MIELVKTGLFYALQYLKNGDTQLLKQ